MQIFHAKQKQGICDYPILYFIKQVKINYILIRMCHNRDV